MAKHILKCVSCGQYTLKSKCPKCGSDAITQSPAKWSPEDKYGSQRRQAKRSILAEKGLI